MLLKIKKLPLLLTLILSLGLISCVGTVEDKNAKDSKVQNATSSDDASSFEGLQLVNAISHDKVELFFYPADGDPNNLTYEIYINNSPMPIKIGGRSLITNASGFYYFQISGLSLQTQYNFNMRVVVAGSEAAALQLDPTKSLSVTTFANETADFAGVSSLTLGAGEAGKNTINVKWVPATITGTNLNPKPRDPVAYEIIYISQVGGISNLNNPKYTGPDRVVIQNPTSLGSPPALNKAREYSITGLLPNTNYYVQVRAIHKAYLDYGITDPLYKREMNTQFLRIKTLAAGALFDFNSSLVFLTNPLGETGLTNLDVSWIPASGEFNHYRVCYKKIGNPGDAEPVVDFLQEADIDAILNNATACIQKSAATTNLRISGLPTYAWYQVKVLACKNVGCDTLNRIRSDLVQKKIITNLAPFTGILSVLNPSDDTKLKEITLRFDAPVVSAGYLNRFKLYCYNSLTDATPVALALDGTTSSGTGKINCDGIKSMTMLPGTLGEYADLDNIVLELPSVNGNARYCFSLLPSINSVYENQESLGSAVVKCFTPEIKTPNIQQFAGRDNNCTIAAKSISVDWPAPTGGLYSKFVVLWREKTTPSSQFNFATASSDFVAGKTNNSALSVYNSYEVPNKTTFTHTINSLIPGRSYSIGVLTLLENGAAKLFSQYNLNMGDCILPLPTPSFTEWVDVFAVGPKEDGLSPAKPDALVPAENLGLRNNILETLDNDAIPVEIATLANESDPNTGNVLANSRLGNLSFNGVYGAKNTVLTNATHQYSNSGIIRIGWKDISMYSGTEYLNSYITNPVVEPTPAIKSSRKFGYKVYRSEDNQLTWVDLTKKSSQNPFQSLANQGVVHPSSFSWKARNNAANITENIVFFTDYSVKFAGVNGEIDRARTYWYKIVPLFDGKELVYNSAANPNHHVIRVTLPPRNMALVHRLIANRTMCLEMNKTIDKGAGQYYSCDYNGLGSSGLSTPWTIGNTVYDQGGDMLIDRFELSCPITRGDVNAVNSDSDWNDTKMRFKGFSRFGNNFKGCFNPGWNGYEPKEGSNLSNTNYTYKQVMPGDCFGKDYQTTAHAFAAACTDPTRASPEIYIYPGSQFVNNTPDCSIDPSLNGANFSDLTDPTSKIRSDSAYFPTQSEYAGVYFMRSGHRFGGAAVPYKIPGGSAQTLSYTNAYRPSSCNVNLAYTNSTGEYRPRWIPVNSLFDKLRKGGTSIPLLKKTMAQIRTNTDLYDATTVIAPTADMMNPGRMVTSSTLGRVVSSNSAKLPPLDGLAQADVAELCSTYKIQVGVETSSRGFVALDTAKTKRLMRRKESTVASAWPAQYDNTKVTAIENGNYTEGAINNSCNSINKPANDGTGGYQMTDFITPNFPEDGKINPLLMVGSSSRDANGTINNTEKCVSRFGIHDMAGNLREITKNFI